MACNLRLLVYLLVTMSAVRGVAAADLASMPDSDRLPGPVFARVLRVVDGDTLSVRARIWLKQEVETFVRVADLDTPEKNGRCQAERAKARDAQVFVESRLAEGWVVLRDIAFEKYGGRVVARVETLDGENLADTVVAAQLGRPYDGGRKRPWCDANP